MLMADRRIKVQLNREQDMDLLGLYLNNPEDFIREAERAILAIANGTEHKIEVPPEGFRNNYEGYLRPSLAIRFTPSEKAREMLDKVKPRMMQSFIKMAIRQSMTRLPYENYLKGDGITCNRQDAEAKGTIGGMKNFVQDDDDDAEYIEETPVQEKKPAKAVKPAAPIAPIEKVEDPKPAPAPSADIDEDDLFASLDLMAHMNT